MAVAAVARKLTTAIWHLLNGNFTTVLEMGKHLETKLLKLATVLGKDSRELGFESRQAFIEHHFNLIQLST